MKVKAVTFAGRVEEVELSAALTPSTYNEGGSVEFAQALAKESAEAIGRTLALLVEKKVLTLQEAREAAGVYVELVE